ncbi:GNAT family N-acetyltransferase [Pontiella agarivorans]|uniref:GNAT family N-acetyltransferase n=1 Tax=Pontiella agarivorans TaxID=3038953 RepID=A0ABU5N0U0_9BACT|nr:GNAT family N-acetyltransferase [Pontiella agarivorans]MDZ8120057.1 GNAT family N-acetyltransferase [Pontiella agarivorans]
MKIKIGLRHAASSDWNRVAELIYMSTNAWYQAKGNPPIFQGAPDSTRLFCEVYDELDASRCLIAADETMGSLAGSCFYHDRETHVSLGIMNVHPNYAGQGVARQLLEYILNFAEEQGKPLRLVSSAMNLDSYSLYNRAGLAPYAVYQDMIFDVPEEGIEERTPEGKRVRNAQLSDVAAMVALEEDVLGIRRGSDFEYFIKNKRGDWHMSVIEDEQGNLDGFLASIWHPASTMLGPGCMRSDESAVALIRRELNFRKGKTMVWLVPSDRPVITQAMYGLGAKNCELHFGQTTGEGPSIRGVVMPTFMPETA